MKPPRSWCSCWTAARGPYNGRHSKARGGVAGVLCAAVGPISNNARSLRRALLFRDPDAVGSRVLAGKRLSGRNICARRCWVWRARLAPPALFLPPSAVFLFPRGGGAALVVGV